MAVDMLAKADFPMDRVKLVVNHPTDVHRVALEQVSEVTGLPVFWEIPYDKQIVRGGQVGMPMVMTKPNSKGPRSMIDLALAISGGRRERRLFGRRGNQIAVTKRDALVPAVEGGARE